MSMKPLPVSAALAALALSAAASNAAAECRLLLEPAQEQWMVQYDPFAGSSQMGSFDIVVSNVGDTPCRGHLISELRGEQFGLSLPGAAERIHYGLIDQRGGGDLTPRTGFSAKRPQGRGFVLSPGERSVERVSFAFDSEQLVSSGIYSQTVFLAAEQEGGSRSERSVMLAVQVPPTAVVGLKGQFSRGDGVPTIDLGPLTEGTRELQTFVYVQSTSGYSMTVSSANQGRLRMGATDWYVDYQLALGDEAINLAQGDRIEVSSARQRHDNYRMGLRIGSVSGKRAGQYSDTLTFVVAAI